MDSNLRSLACGCLLAFSLTQGCDQHQGSVPDPPTATLPTPAPGTAITYERDSVNTTPEVKATASGASLQTTAADQAGGFNATAPRQTIGADDSADQSGGAAKINWDLKGLKFNPLWLFAGLFGAGGIICLVWPLPIGLALRPASKPCFVIAAVCGVCASIGASLPWVLVGLVVAGLGLYLWEAKSHATTKTTPSEGLRAALAAAYALPYDAWSAWSDAFHKQADSADVAEVNVIKQQDNLIPPLAPPAKT